MKFAEKTWEIIYPVGIYYVTIIIVTFCAGLLFGVSDGTYMLCKVIGSAVTLLVVWTYYKRDLALEGKLGRRVKFSGNTLLRGLCITGITAMISIAINNIIMMSPLMTISKEYEDTANAFYGGPIGIEILGLVLLTPILEEMLHRGHNNTCRLPGGSGYGSRRGYKYNRCEHIPVLRG